MEADGARATGGGEAGGAGCVKWAETRGGGVVGGHGDARRDGGRSEDVRGEARGGRGGARANAPRMHYAEHEEVKEPSSETDSYVEEEIQREFRLAKQRKEYLPVDETESCASDEVESCASGDSHVSHQLNLASTLASPTLRFVVLNCGLRTVTALAVLKVIFDTGATACYTALQCYELSSPSST